MSDRTRRTVVMLIVGALIVLPVVGLLALERVTAVGPSTDRPLAILLLGSDGGPPRADNPITSRADGFQLLFVSAERDRATFVSIPRDSWVPVTGLGDNKINACLTRGPENCVTTVENAFGIEIDAYFVTSMWGFAEAVNEFVGCETGGPENGSRECTRGLEIDVDFACRQNCSGFPIEERGVQKLSGYEALTVARNRANRSNGDFTRSASQAELLAVAHATMQQDGSVARMMETLRILRRHSVTDLTLPQLTRLGLDAMRLDPENVERILAPSRIGSVGAASVVFLNDPAYDIISEAAETGRLPEEFRD